MTGGTCFTVAEEVIPKPSRFRALATINDTGTLHDNNDHQAYQRPDLTATYHTFKLCHVTGETRIECKTTTWLDRGHRGKPVFASIEICKAEISQ